DREREGRRQREVAAIVHARLFAGEVGPLEMKAQNTWVAADGGVDRVQRAPHFLAAVADQRRQKARRSAPPMRHRDRADALHGRLIVEEYVAAAIHLQADESGRQPRTLRQRLNGNLPRQVRRGDEIGDARPVHDDGRALTQSGAVEQTLSRYGVQPRAVHLVRVTFCKWRGTSTSVPRARATLIAKA